MVLAVRRPRTGFGGSDPNSTLYVSCRPCRRRKIMLKKPQTRHQSTMGMGLSGLGGVSPSRSPTPGQNINPRDVSRSSSIARPIYGIEMGDSDDSGYDSEDGLDFGDDDIPITGFAVATMTRNQEFHELFPTIPVDDYLIDGVSQRSLLVKYVLIIIQTMGAHYNEIS